MHYFPRMNVPAIVKALLFTILLSLVLGIGVGMALLALVSSDALSDETINESFLFSVSLYAIGMIPDVVGGYLVALFAKRHVFHHALVMGLVLMALGGAFLCQRVHKLEGPPTGGEIDSVA